MSVLLSTAYLDEAERCDEVILMHAGERLGQGSPASFSAPMRGRTFRVTAPGLAKRTLQARLSAAPGIVDAIIEGEQVRVVTADTGLPDLSAVAGEGELHTQPAEPVFEDAFIARLKGTPASGNTPAAASRWPRLLLIEPSAQKPRLVVRARKTLVRAATSTGSPSAVPVPCAST